MKIKVKESTIVQPAKETPKHTLRSSTLDLFAPRYIAPTVYFYKPEDGSENFFDTRLLKESLSNCLVVFYPVAGRLRRRSSGGGFDVDCNGEGVLFVDAESEAVIDDFGDFTPCLDFQELIPTVDCSNDPSSCPLLMLQVTHFTCGGASLGVGFQHTLADGMSAIHFINTWSDMTRGLSVTIPPFFDRTLLCARDPPSPTYHHTEFDLPPCINTPVQNQECQTSPKLTTTAIIKITLDQLNTLKANTKNDKNPTKYSTFEILAAHVWRCTCTARALRDDQATKLYIATDGRSRLCPPIPPGYFGNVIFNTTSLASSLDLRSQALKSAVGKIHDALSRMDDDYLRSALDYLALQPDPTVLTPEFHTYNSIFTGVVIK